MDLFHFKQFSIEQAGSAMKIGTDGVLLGAWAPCDQARFLLDIGTGSGLIALMAAQRSRATIDALELEEEACRQAEKNFTQSPWADRLHLLRGDFNAYALSAPEKQYDVILSNPPFFNKSLKNKEHKKSMARHDDSLSPEALLKNTGRLIHPGGIFCMIYPYEKLEGLILLASHHHWYPSRITQVLTGKNQTPKRALLCLERTKKTCRTESLPLHGNETRGLSTEYIQLTRPFYRFL